MKLIRFGEAGKEMPGIFLNGKLYDVSRFIRDYDEPFFTHGGLPHLAWMVSQHENMLPLIPAGMRLGPPVARPSKIICIGLNYVEHAKESGGAAPNEPVIFLKATTALCGPFDDVIIPKNSVKTDWEVELAIVIGKRCSYVDPLEAVSHVAGYCLHNDVSEREYQLERGGTWDKGKGCDTFAPMGPWLVTTDEMPVTDNLNLWLKVNGKIMQQGTTANMVFNVPFLVSYCSRFMTLLPGDIISTGTPGGVGLGMNPPLYLVPGDRMEMGVDGLGEAQQKCVAYAN